MIEGICEATLGSTRCRGPSVYCALGFEVLQGSSFADESESNARIPGLS